MDERTPPTAADLGISEAEYERILRDLDDRLRGDDAGIQGEPGSSWTPSPLRRTVAKSLLVGAIAPLALVLALLGRAPASDTEPEHAFLDMTSDGPVGYTSCRPIQVAVYPAGGPPDAVELTRDAVARVAGVTGLDIRVIGPFGGAAPNWNFEAAPVHADGPISVSWQDGDAIAELTDHVAGLGGSRVMDYPDGRRRLVAGTIALSIDYYQVLEAAGDRELQRAILLHELGHVFGLDHVDNPGELMSEDGSGLTDYGPGDLEGLGDWARRRASDRAGWSLSSLGHPDQVTFRRLGGRDPDPTEAESDQEYGRRGELRRKQPGDRQADDVEEEQHRDPARSRQGQQQGPRDERLAEVERTDPDADEGAEPDVLGQRVQPACLDRPGEGQRPEEHEQHRVAGGADAADGEHPRAHQPDLPAPWPQQREHRWQPHRQRDGGTEVEDRDGQPAATLVLDDLQ